MYTGVGEKVSRAYTLKKRAEAQARTRRRIVTAAVELHGSRGPAYTSISAVAKRAGVQRATVYDHFPNESALFEACTAHYFDRHRPPDPSRWADIEEPLLRFRAALGEAYAYYRRVEPMMTRAYRDAQIKPEIFETQAARAHGQHWERVTSELVAAWGATAEGHPLLAAAVGHAFSFQTWHQLAAVQKLPKERAVELMVKLVRCAAIE